MTGGPGLTEKERKKRKGCGGSWAGLLDWWPCWAPGVAQMECCMFFFCSEFFFPFSALVYLLFEVQKYFGNTLLNW
jgi:hypothetical protein